MLLLVEGSILYATRAWYYTNGKWDFAVVFLALVLMILVLLVGALVVWKLTNIILVKPVDIDCCSQGDC